MYLKNILLVSMLVLPPAAAGAGPANYYFIAVQNGAYNFEGGEKQLEESYKALGGMVKLADAQNVRLTLLFSAQYAVYIASDPARLAEVEGWKAAGHELGAYHQGPDRKGWDGYSDLPAGSLARIRKEDRAGKAAPGHLDYFAALNRLEPLIKSGCMIDGKDKKFILSAPAYEICGGPALAGASRGAAWNKGASDFLAVTGDSETVKKNLACFHPADKTGIAAAEKAFSGLRHGVYGASFKSSPDEFGAFYAWLAFLRSLDPQGTRSRTVSAVVDGRLLAEKQALYVPAVFKTKAQSVQPQPEVPKQELPRLKRLQSFYGTVGKLRLGPPAGWQNLNQSGYCGDGTCDAFERAHPGRCPGDCNYSLRPVP